MVTCDQLIKTETGNGFRTVRAVMNIMRTSQLHGNYIMIAWDDIPNLAKVINKGMMTEVFSQITPWTHYGKTFIKF